METLEAASACHVLALKRGEMMRCISIVQTGFVRLVLLQNKIREQI